MDMQKLYIIRGVPGAGKSTLAKQLAPNAHYEADAYMVDANGEYAFDPKRLPEVHAMCLQAVCEALMAGAPVVAVANTFVRRWEYQRYVDLAVELGVTYEIIVCDGGYHNIHGVGGDVIERMRANWED